MTLLIVQWAIPQFGASLAPKMVTMAKVTYSTTQLVAALLVHSLLLSFGQS